MVSGIGVRRGLSSESVVSTAEYPTLAVTAGWWARVASTSTATTFRRAWPGLARCSATCRHQPSTDAEIQESPHSICLCTRALPQHNTTVPHSVVQSCTALHSAARPHQIASDRCSAVRVGLCSTVALPACSMLCVYACMLCRLKLRRPNAAKLSSTAEPHCAALRCTTCTQQSRASLQLYPGHSHRPLIICSAQTDPRLHR